MEPQKPKKKRKEKKWQSQTTAEVRRGEKNPTGRKERVGAVEVWGAEASSEAEKKV